MPEFSLYSYPWAVVVLCALLYVSDAWLTIYCAKLLDRGADRHLKIHRSYELNPMWQKAVNTRRQILFTPKFLLVLTLLVLYFSLVAWLPTLAPSRFPAIQWLAVHLFELVTGTWILLELHIHIRHLRNAFLFRSFIQGTGIRGRLEQSFWLSLRISAFETFLFGLCYLLFWMMLDFRMFFLGGALGCLGMGLRHYRMSRRFPPDQFEDDSKDTTNQEILAS